MKLAPLFAAALLLACTASLSPATPPGKTQQLTSPDQVPEGLAKSDWHSIRAAYEAGRHAFQPIEGGWQTRNPGQQWITKFDGRGFVAEPRDGAWQWGLELKGYGFPGAERAVGGVPAVKAEGQRLTYGWDAAVQEWWVNDARGLEHGFTVRERPRQERPTSNIQLPTSNETRGAALAPFDVGSWKLDVESSSPCLSFTLAVRGTLTPVITADALGVEFRDAAGATVLTYAGLKVWDADGKLLASRFAPLDTRHPTLVTLQVEERGARYPLTIDPIAQQAYLKPAAVGTTQAGDQFGYSVAISGDTVVVGAYQEDSSSLGVNSTPNELASIGAAYVFVRSGTTWTQQAYLKPAAVTTYPAGDEFGRSVAISGDTVIVGAPGEGSNTTGVNSTPNFDNSANYSGAAYVFLRSGTTWTQQAYLKPAVVGTTQANDYFGWSVAVSGDTVVVGAYQEDSSTTGVNSAPNESASNSGAAYVFERSGTTWTQQAYLKPAAVGTTQAGDQFGYSVAVSGDTLIVGAVWEDSSTTGVNSTVNELAGTAGAAYVFVRSGTIWSQQAYLKPAAVGTTQAGDWFGASVAVSGDTIVVGAWREDSSSLGVNSTPNESAPGGTFGAGAAYVFVRSGTTWTQQAYLKPAAVGTTQSVDQFGYSVAVSGDTVVVGAPGEDSSTTGVNSTPDESASSAGAAYVFLRSGTTWTQQAYLKPAAVGTTQVLDWSGTSVAVSGDTVVVGARLEDSSTTGVNSTPEELAADSGAAYVFTGAPTGPNVNTSAASGITSTSATLNGTVNPNGLETTAQFEYGTTTGYGSTATVTLSPNNSITAQQVNAAISNLMPETLYHYRLTATNGSGTTNGLDQTFTAAPVDTDGDGIRDRYETGTGIYVSPTDTGTSPTNRDTDGDGLDDGDEITTHLTNPNIADTDGDGFGDGFEVSTGFSPTSAASTPDALSTILIAAEYRFNAANGVSYRIETSTDLVTWTTLETPIIGAGGVVTRFYSTEGQPKRFFRSRRN